MPRRSRIATALTALRTSTANRALLLIQLARLASVTGRWAYAVTLAVYAYREAGADGVAVAALVRLIPAAAAAPLTGAIVARVRVRKLLFWGGIARTTALAAAGALVLTGQPVWTIFAAVGCESAISSVLRPVQSSLLPSLVRTPSELTAANLTLSVIESAGLLIGPLLGALLLRGSSVGIVFVVAAAAYTVSAALLLAVRTDDAAASDVQSRPWREAFSGLRQVAADRDTAVVLTLYGAQNIVAGAPLPLPVAALWTRLSRLDARAQETPHVDVLGEIAIFAPLPARAVERLARQLTELSVGPGDVVFSQGDVGDAFYVVERGGVEVMLDGKRLSVLGPSDFFGEIALLRDVRRTATVRALGNGAGLLRLAREPFLATVTGNRQSTTAAHAVVGARLGLETG